MRLRYHSSAHDATRNHHKWRDVGRRISAGDMTAQRVDNSKSGRRYIDFLVKFTMSKQTSDALRYAGLAALAAATASSSLTFSWVVEHRANLNVFPEFAGRVIYLSDIFLIVGIGLWLLGRLASKEKVWRFGPRNVTVPLLVLVAISNLSILWAADGAQAGYTAVRLVWLFGLYFVAMNESPAATKLFLAAFFVIGILQAVVAVGQVIEGSVLGLSALGEVTEGAMGYTTIGSPRGVGLGFNQNPVGLFLALCCVLAYAYFLIKRPSQRINLLIIVTLSIAFAGLIATFSRSAILALVLAFVVVTVLSKLTAMLDYRRISRRIGVVLLVTLPWIWLVPASPQIVQAITYLGASAIGAPAENTRTSTSNLGLSRFTSPQISSGFGSRIRDIQYSIPILQEHAIFGVGAGNYPIALRASINPNSIGGIYTPIHNVPLLITAELGIVGSVAWAIIMLAPVIWVIRQRGKYADDAGSVLWLGGLILLLSVSLLDFPPWASQDGRVIFWALLGLWAGSMGENGRSQLP